MKDIEDYLVTFGITPSFAESRFGYIEAQVGEDDIVRLDDDFDRA